MGDRIQRTVGQPDHKSGSTLASFSLKLFENREDRKSFKEKPAKKKVKGGSIT